MPRTTQTIAPEPDQDPDSAASQTLDHQAADNLKDSSSEFRQQHQSAIKDDVQIDFVRGQRCGFPEAIFGEGKSAEHLLEIAQQQLGKGIPVFVTRITDANAEMLGTHYVLRHNPIARTVLIPTACNSAAVSTPESVKEKATSDSQVESVDLTNRPKSVGYVPVLAAGTTDLPVVEEAIETLNWMNIGTRKIMDVGVAGPHRLPERLHELENADAVVVVAGMEGALPSVVGGYVNCPVIAVPTSVGYGANLGGVSALLSMLNSCAANVSVVNIDAGFKGAYVAGLISSRAHQQNQTSR